MAVPATVFTSTTSSSGSSSSTSTIGDSLSDDGGDAAWRSRARATAAKPPDSISRPMARTSSKRRPAPLRYFENPYMDQAVRKADGDRGVVSSRDSVTGQRRRETGDGGRRPRSPPVTGTHDESGRPKWDRDLTVGCLREELATVVAYHNSDGRSGAGEADFEDQISVYVGVGGYALTLARIATSSAIASRDRRDCYLTVAQDLMAALADEILEAGSEGGDDAPFSTTFLTGEGGALALAAVLLRTRTPELSARCLARLGDLARFAVEEASDELLYGKAGYLTATVFANAFMDAAGANGVESARVRSVVEAIVESGRARAAASQAADEAMGGCKRLPPLDFDWNGVSYLGTRPDGVVIVWSFVSDAGVRRWRGMDQYLHRDVC